MSTPQYNCMRCGDRKVIFYFMAGRMVYSRACKACNPEEWVRTVASERREPR